MGEPKPIASLSGLLLARKGAARPAMRRPASFGNSDEHATNQDDLGWNDMGYDVDPDPSTPMDHDHSASRNPLAGAVPEATADVRHQQEMIAQRLQHQAEVGFESLPSDVQQAVEEVEAKAETTSRSVEDILSRKQPEAKPMGDLDSSADNMPAVSPAIAEAPKTVVSKPVAKPRKRAAAGSKDKAAFTLRLDKDRHLKLRLACAVSNRSAQNLVTDALDALLDNMPEIGQLAARVPQKQ